MKQEKIFLEKNFIAGILATGFGSAMLLTTGMSRGLYPAVIFSLLTIFGMLTSISSIRKPTGSIVEKVSKREIFLILSLFINPVLAKFIGFYVAGFLEISIISLIIAPQRDRNSVMKILGFALAATLATYLIFTVGLRIRCPRGALLLF